MNVVVNLAKRTREINKQKSLWLAKIQKGMVFILDFYQKYI